MPYFAELLMVVHTVVGIICAVVTAGATVTLAWLTYRYVKLTASHLEAQREAHAPRLALSFKPHSTDSWILAVSNTGLDPATNVSFGVGEAFRWESATSDARDTEHSPEKWPRWEEVALIRDGVAQLAPMQAVSATITVAPGCFPAGVLKINSTYTDGWGNVRECPLIIDSKIVDSELRHGK